MGDTILLIEDDVTLLGAVEELLIEEGYSTVAYQRADAALEWLQSGHRAEAIIVDWKMPVMDGLEFRRQQLRTPAVADIPAILVTANPVAKAPIAELGLAGIVKKPFDIDQLLEQLRLVLDARVGTS